LDAQVGLGNQLKTVNIIEPELRQRFAARYGFEPDSNKDCFVA
jgi:mRNA (2'-O-methyladenosine-N6-)-methyltransferase